MNGGGEERKTRGRQICRTKRSLRRWRAKSLGAKASKRRGEGEDRDVSIGRVSKAISSLALRAGAEEGEEERAKEYEELARNTGSYCLEMAIGHFLWLSRITSALRCV